MEGNRVNESGTLLGLGDSIYPPHKLFASGGCPLLISMEAFWSRKVLHIEQRDEVQPCSTHFPIHNKDLGYIFEVWENEDLFPAPIPLPRMHGKGVLCRLRLLAWLLNFDKRKTGVKVVADVGQAQLPVSSLVGSLAADKYCGRKAHTSKTSFPVAYEQLTKTLNQASNSDKELHFVSQTWLSILYVAPALQGRSSRGFLFTGCRLTTATFFLHRKAVYRMTVAI